ncbi:MAG: hypothetical protein LBP33_00210 [Candidatus Adiutrix sp.]|jgi:hypothetical protein|nr:hypothetical protein [Candidatus Adiutrix sp.]
MDLETLMRSDKPAALRFWKIFTVLFVLGALAGLGIIIYFLHGAFKALFSGDEPAAPSSPAAIESPAGVPAGPVQPPAATDDGAVQNGAPPLPPTGLQDESSLKFSIPGFYQDRDGVWRNVDTGGDQAESPAFSASLPEAWPLKSLLPEGRPLQGPRPADGRPGGGFLGGVLSEALSGDRTLLESLLANTLKSADLSSGGPDLQSLLEGLGSALGKAGSAGRAPAAEIYRDSDGVWRNYPPRPDSAGAADEWPPGGLLSLDPQGLSALFGQAAGFTPLSPAVPGRTALSPPDVIRDFSGFEYFKPEEAADLQSDWDYFEDPRGPLPVR